MKHIEVVPVVVVSTTKAVGEIELTLAWPAEPHDARGLYCTCYSEHEGHGAASPEWLKSQSIAPKPIAEAAVARYIKTHPLPDGMVYMLTPIWDKQWRKQREDKARKYNNNHNNN